MELELKHLTSYLPYEVECEYGAIDEPERGVLTQLDCAMNIPEGRFGHLSKVVVPLSLIRPILRPLSDLTKEIEHKGEKFVPLQKLGWKTNHQEELGEFLEDPIHYPLSIQEFQKLFEWHFDVFGLLGADLAIPYSEIEEKAKV